MAILHFNPRGDVWVMVSETLRQACIKRLILRPLPSVQCPLDEDLALPVGAQ